MILISYGTRPEYIKLKPLMDRLKQDCKGDSLVYKTLFTGQHKDLVKQKADYNIEINKLIDESASLKKISDETRNELQNLTKESRFKRI